MVHTGSCLCGRVRFQIEGELAPIRVCHCLQCRKAQGGPFATVIPVDASAFRLLGGEQLLKSYESSPGKQRVFCSHCGSPVFSRRQAIPDVVRVRVGLIDEPVGAGLAWHAYTGSRCDWWPIEDRVPQYVEGHGP